MKSSKRLRRDKQIIEKALKKYLGQLKGPLALRRAMWYAVFPGGKRLRPILALESCRVLGGDIKKALPYACAIELVHNFSLVHDDLPAMDNDDTRRGKPACHKKFNEGLAILAGDALLNLAFGVLSKSRRKDALEVVSDLSNAIGVENMIGGQVLDLEHQNQYRVFQNPVLNKINSMKTAALIAFACKVGALAAHAKSRDVKRIYQFGRNFGLAFQMADDMKDTGPKAGLREGMREEVKNCIRRAKIHIASFGNKADTLCYIVDSILTKA